MRDSKTLSNEVRQYCDLIEQVIERITVERLEYYPDGLARVIESGLKQCHEWGMSDKVERRYGQKLNMEDTFKGLCVSEKQTAAFLSTRGAVAVLTKCKFPQRYKHDDSWRPCKSATLEIWHSVRAVCCWQTNDVNARLDDTAKSRCLAWAWEFLLL